MTPKNFYGGGEGDTGLAAMRLDNPSSDLCFVPGEYDFTAVYGFSPEGDIVGDSVVLKIPNTTGLADGETVQIYVMGGLQCSLDEDGNKAHEGEWQLLGNGTVEGDFISPDGGVALPCINWMAYGP